MQSYKTIFREADAEIVINKSRFIGYACPIKSESEAQEFIEKIKKEHRMATHNVPVYILGNNHSVQKYSDDGEPSGTAGLPILNMLKNEGITDIAIVVTRYFGGIKLGTGGLVRAYTQSAKEVLDVAKVIQMVKYQHLKLNLSYANSEKVKYFIEKNSEYLVDDIIYTDKVEILVYIRPDDIEPFIQKIKDICNEIDFFEYLDEEYLSISDKEWVR